MGNDIERIVEADKREQVQTGYILYGIFVADAFRQFPVCTHFIAERADAPDEIAVCHFECGAAYAVAGVEYRSVSQYDAGGEKHLVAVGMRTAVHARSVVHDDTTHHGAFYGGRVGSEFPSERSQQFIDPLPDDTGLQGDFFVVGRYAVAFPMFAGYNKYGVTDGLSG